MKITVNDNQTLPKFNQLDFVNIRKDNKSNLVVQMKQTGIELVKDYYANKYKTNISLPPCKEIIFYMNSKTYLDEVREKSKTFKDYRHAFFIGASDTHAVPVIYIKENGQEGLLLADSLGVIIENAKLLQESTGIDVYAVDLPRQADAVSCYNDAMVFCRDSTAKIAETDEYYIPNLLDELKTRATTTLNKYHTTKLPNKLLKTAQISKFVTNNEKSDDEASIHKTLNLKQFRNKYSDRLNWLAKLFKKKATANYLRLKGIKFIDIIEIQFYISEILKKFDFPPSKQELFIQEAKKKLKSDSNDRLYNFANDFINQHQLAQKFFPLTP